ncbi:XRE family transcriptional regulator [Edaphobacter aggregans]|uniref:XRE family transcriptional regulator n=1 Tax=Edaphobacter aggregans TaxID=570835 RepID=UPI000A0522B6|nr:XRE family transcriptional regulator [Edaphobacter aggregans]
MRWYRQTRPDPAFAAAIARPSPPRSERSRRRRWRPYPRRINQPKVSALLHYKLEGFSVERLMRFLVALGQDVEIIVKAKPRSRSARIAVCAA